MVKTPSRRRLVIGAVVVAAILIGVGAAFGWRAINTRTAEPSVAPATEPSLVAGPGSEPSQGESPTGPGTESSSAASSSASPSDLATDAYCGELESFAREWPASGEHSDPRDVSELITAYQEVADAAVPAVRPEWDELMATYRQAEALVHLDRDLTKDELAELDRLNDEITRLAGEIDAKNAGICVGDDPSTGA